MKNIIKILSFTISFFALFGTSFAINAPTNLILDSSNESSVSLSWDTTENAIMYYVYYSKNSGLETGYDMQSDFIETTSLQIDNLEPGSTYYFVVIAIDENVVESVYSNELIVDTVDPNKTNNIDFALDSIESIEYNKIGLTFTKNLNNSTDTIREFKIVNKNDNLDTFEVLSTELDKNNSNILELTLDRNTTIGNEYDVVIIAITSEDGNNIESGIDNTETFTVVEIIKSIPEPIIESTPEPIIEGFIDLNSAGPSGINIDASEIENTTISLANSNDSLPKTGAEHVLILILSIILGALIFVFNYKRV